MLVLEGDQGIRKSSGLRELASSPWFADEIGDPGSKDAADALRGKWIVEIGELRWSKSDEETRKAFISRRVDHYRPAYGRRTIDAARQCVFSATTNSREWQTDPTGARRYWAVACLQGVRIDAIARDRDLLWGEAMHRYREHEQSWLTDAEAEAHRLALHERREVDPWEAEILVWAEDRPPFPTEEVLEHLRIDQGHRSAREARRVSAILRRAGYEQSRPRSGSTSRARVWSIRVVHESA
jgi:putative DNA primase/helicase